MQSLQEQIHTYEQEINAFEPADTTALETYRIRFLGTKGIVKQIFGEMKNVPVDQKRILLITLTVASHGLSAHKQQHQ